MHRINHAIFMKKIYNFFVKRGEKMELKEAIEKRKSVIGFSKDKPLLKDVFDVIDSARLAPSSKNRQPWNFYVLSGKEKDEMVKSFVEKLSQNQTEATGFGSARLMNEAPYVVLVFMDEINGYEDIAVNYLAVGAAIQNALLTAKSLGFDSLWIYDLVHVIGKQLKEKIGASGNLVSAFCLGKDAFPDKRKVQKRKLEDVIINFKEIKNELE